MAKNTMADLRDHLFEALEQLKDEEKPMELDRAKAICNVAGKLIDSAKVEVKYLEVTGREATKRDFFDKPELPPAPDDASRRRM